MCVQFFFPGALVVPSVRGRCDRLLQPSRPTMTSLLLCFLPHVTGWTLPTVEPSSAASYRAVRSAVARMQYGYMDQQQNYQQSYGGVQWRIDSSYGVQAMPQFRFPALPKYWALPYTVRNGEDQVLSRWNMMSEALTVSRVQCMVRVLADGTPTLVGCGKAPSLFRAFGGPWSPLYKGESVLLSDGLQVSLDCNDPEGAVLPASTRAEAGRAATTSRATHSRAATRAGPRRSTRRAGRRTT